MSKIFVEIVKTEKHINLFNIPTSFYRFRHTLILYEAREKTHF